MIKKHLKQKKTSMSQFEWKFDSSNKKRPKKMAGKLPLVAVLHLLVVLVQAGQNARARVVFGVHPPRHPLVRGEVGHVRAVHGLERVPVEVGLLGQRWAGGELFGGRGHHLVCDS